MRSDPHNAGVEVEGAGLWAERCPSGLPSISEAPFIEFGIIDGECRPAMSGVGVCSLFILRFFGVKGKRLVRLRPKLTTFWVVANPTL